MINLDIYLFNLINHLPHPGWLDQIALLLESLGEFQTMCLFTGALFLASLILKKKRLWAGAVFLGFTISSTALAANILKHLIHRPRPFTILTDAYLIGHAVHSASFPSGHASLFAALGAFMIFAYRKNKFFWSGLVFLGGIGRIYQGVHYPTDVVAGWFLGILFAWLVSSAYKLLIATV